MLLTAWSRTQTCIALSTCEAEILALKAVAADALLAVSLLTELDLDVDDSYAQCQD